MFFITGISAGKSGRPLSYQRFTGYAFSNRETCVGLAANMIGVQKRVIIFNLGLVPVVMFNPVLLSSEGSL